MVLVGAGATSYPPGAHSLLLLLVAPGEPALHWLSDHGLQEGPTPWRQCGPGLAIQITAFCRRAQAFRAGTEPQQAEGFFLSCVRAGEAAPKRKGRAKDGLAVTIKSLHGCPMSRHVPILSLVHLS